MTIKLAAHTLTAWIYYPPTVIAHDPSRAESGDVIALRTEKRVLNVSLP